MILGFSRVVGSIFLFGFGMITVGILLAIFKGAFVNLIKDMYWIENTPFLNLMDVEYNVIALIIMIMGLICVVIAGVESHKEDVHV